MNQPQFSADEPVFVVRLDERRITKPLTMRQIVAHLKKKTLTPQHSVKWQGATDWITISELLQGQRTISVASKKAAERKNESVDRTARQQPPKEQDVQPPGTKRVAVLTASLCGFVALIAFAAYGIHQWRNQGRSAAPISGIADTGTNDVSALGSPVSKEKAGDVAAAVPSASIEVTPAKAIVADPNENPLGIEFVRIPPSMFEMGSDYHYSSYNEEPVHTVQISKPFYASKYEITVGQVLQWLKTPGTEYTTEWFYLDQDDCPIGRTENSFGLNESSVFGQSEKQPMQGVSWHGAVAFCEWCSEQNPRFRYRLPTEAEWEYLARAGSDTEFPWGQHLDGTEANVNGDEPFGTKKKGPRRKRTTEVGSFSPNKFGLFDTVGNVAEWCHDSYQEDAYETRSAGISDPVLDRGPESERVLRGGSWESAAGDARSSHRRGAKPEYPTGGFRVIVDDLQERPEELASTSNQPLELKDPAQIELRKRMETIADWHDADMSLEWKTYYEEGFWAHAIRERELYDLGPSKIIPIGFSKGWLPTFSASQNSDWSEIVSNGLPSPEFSFGIDLSSIGKKVTDVGVEQLAQLAKRGELQYLDLSEANITDEAIHTLSTLKNLKYLDLSNTKISGTGLNELAALTELTYLDISFTPITDAGLKELSSLKQLTELHLTGTTISEVGLKEISTLSQLKSLMLFGVKIGDDGLKELSEMTELRVLTFSDAPITDAGLEQLTRLQHLRVLSVDRSAITDTGIDYIASMKRMEHLGLSGTQISDEGLRKLSGLGELESITLERTKVSGAGFSEFANHPKLHDLDLYASEITDEGMRALAQLPKLTRLKLSQTKVTDDGLKELAGLSELKELWLADTKVGDAGLMALARLKELTDLRLSNTDVTDTGLQQLERLTGLTYLDLYDTAVTDTGVKELKDQLPDCRISAN